MKKQRLAIAIGAGVAVATPFAVQGSLVSTAIAVVVGAFVFDQLLILAERHARSRLMKLGPVPESIPIRPVLTFCVAAKPREIAGVIERAAADLSKGASLKATDDTFSALEGGVPASIKSGYGELLTAAIRPANDEWHRVTLTSRPRPTLMANVQVDFGRNFRNVRRLANACEAAFGVARVREFELKDAEEEAR
jgi:hypothetical protein